MYKFTTDQINHALNSLDGWGFALEKPGICKTFRFRDFNRAWQFMTASALLAEQMGHHPEWSNMYNTVTVVLTTHDAGGVTEKDITMARAMENFAA